MDRAFSRITIKSVDEDRRELEGWASTPSTDRQNDQLLPEGAKFELPLPLLLDHDHTKVCGEVYRAEVSKAGIRFWARVKKIAEPGAAKDFVDYCWALIKNSLRPVVSVGFRPLTYEIIEGGGLRFLTWEWYELSACAVAAQPEAKITATKATRGDRSTVVRLSATPKSDRVVRLNPLARAQLNGTLKINVTRHRPGDPIKIVRTQPKVVKLDRSSCTWLDRANEPLRVVKLTPRDHARAKHRVVKLR
jgi:hypothetical protein